MSPRHKSALKFLIPSLLVGIPLLTACQVYTSPSRTLFEQQAPNSLASTNVGTHSGNLPSQNMSDLETRSSSCWSQPKEEKLWFAKAGMEYQVKILDETAIEVCLADKN